ncbi:MAG: hypothetical protein NVS1B1_12240 [Candidatus Limnocylindrales bacterium]
MLRPDASPTIDRPMLITLLVSVAAFTLIYSYLMTVRVGIELRRQQRLLAARDQ